MNKNTMPELFDEQPDGMEQPTQEQILMSESELLRGLIEAGNEKDSEASYERIQIKRGGVLKFEFRIRPISEEESLACHDHATKFAPRKRGQPKREMETNLAKFRSWLIYTATVDEDQAKTWDNKKAQEALNVLNLKRGNVIRKSAEELSLKNDLLRRLIRELVTPGDQKEPLKIYADDKESYFKASYIPIINTDAGKDEPSKLGDVILLKNITEFKELDSAKTTFISTISHELKTPIAAIMMSLQLLEDKRVGELNDEQEQLSKSIKEISDELDFPNLSFFGRYCRQRLGCPPSEFRQQKNIPE